MRRATPTATRDDKNNVFLSTLSLRRATQTQRAECRQKKISIHALLAESDNDSRRRTYRQDGFLSTLSLRRATGSVPARLAPRAHFYPRSPCGERHQILEDTSGATDHFYPRSPCGERQPGEHHASNQQEFLSTLSLRRATQPPRFSLS